MADKRRGDGFKAAAVRELGAAAARGNGEAQRQLASIDHVLRRQKGELDPEPFRPLDTADWISFADDLAAHVDRLDVPVLLQREIELLAEQEEMRIERDGLEAQLVDVLAESVRRGGQLRMEGADRASFEIRDAALRERLDAVAAQVDETAEEFVALAVAGAGTGPEPEDSVAGIARAIAQRVIAVEHPRPQPTVGIPLPDSGDTGEKLWLPTPTLWRLSEIAAEERLPGALGPGELAALAPDGRHIASSADVIAATIDGRSRHYVRCRMDLKTRDGSDPVREVALPMRQFGYLIDSVRVRSGAHGDLLDRLPPAQQPRGIDGPKWIGSRSYSEVWNRNQKLANAAVWFSRNRSDRELRRRASEAHWMEIVDLACTPRAMVAMDALERLREARVLAVDVDVFEGAPEWDSPQEAAAWAAQARLPFDPLYIDLTAAGNLSPLILAETNGGQTVTVVLRGALIWRDEERLHVLPVAVPDVFANRNVGPKVGPRDSYIEWDFVAQVSFGGLQPPEAINYRVMRPEDSRIEVSAVAAVMPTPYGIDGEIVVLPDLGFDTARETAEIVQPEAYARMWATVGFLAACRTLSILGMLEAINIEIGEPKPTNEDRRTLKRATKRGWQVEIARTVTIRAAKHRAKPTEPAGEEPARRDFTHAFWRRGNYAHYPLGTRIADKLAAENPGDARLVEHPEKGLCRKVYRGPTLIGKTDADGNDRRVVEKTRVWRKPPTPRRPIDPPAAEAA